MGDRAFCVWVDAPMQSGLIDNASAGKSIRDHIHLMHEADSYALKKTCPLTLSPRPGRVGRPSPVARGLGGGCTPTLDFTSAQFQTKH